MVEVRDFDMPDLVALDGPPMHDALRIATRDAANSGPAWTVTHGNRVIACAGFALVWNGRAVAWCLLARDIPRTCWVAMHRAVVKRMRELPELGVRRVEADVLFDFEAGERWVRLLGMEFEGVMRAYGPDGRAYSRFAKVF